MDNIEYTVETPEGTKVYKGIRRYSANTSISARLAVVDADEYDLWEVEGFQSEATLHKYYSDTLGPNSIEHITFLQPCPLRIPDVVIVNRAGEGHYEFAVIDMSPGESEPVADVIPLEDGTVAWQRGGQVVRFCSPADAIKAERAVESVVKTFGLTRIEDLRTQLAEVIVATRTSQGQAALGTLITAMEETMPGFAAQMSESVGFRLETAENEARYTRGH